MSPIIFVLLVSIVSRLIWSKRYPFEPLRTEVTYFGLIVLVNLIWFAFCVWAFGIQIP
jgi:hypothetical protein